MRSCVQRIHTKATTVWLPEVKEGAETRVVSFSLIYNALILLEQKYYCVMGFLKLMKFQGLLGGSVS